MDFMYVLLVLSIVLMVSKSSVYNIYAKSENPNVSGVFFFNAFSYAVASIVALCTGGLSAVSLPTVICAFFYAAIVFSLQSLSVIAMKKGPMSLTSLIVMFGMIIPALAGPIFWGEPFGVLQGVGIAVMLASLWLLKENKAGETATNAKWWILAALCFVLSGMAGVMEKIHQSTDGSAEKTSFVLLACSMMFAFSVLGTAVTSFRARGKRISRNLLIWAPISGLLVGLISGVNLTLAGGLNSTVYYPVSNGGALLLTVLISTVVFREKPTARKMIGFAMGLCGVLLLSIPA